MDAAPRHLSLITPPAMMHVEHDADSPISDNGGGHGLNSKSRNARAQARHRAKRKAYIEQVCSSLSFQLVAVLFIVTFYLQLEASVSSLTETLNDLKQRGIDDPSSLRFMALEAENHQLRHENAQLRQENNHFRDQLADAVRSTPPKIPMPTCGVDEYGYPRESYKRRKRSADESFLASASVSYILYHCSVLSSLPGRLASYIRDAAPTFLSFFYVYSSPFQSRGSLILVSSLISRWRPRRLELCGARHMGQA